MVTPSVSLPGTLKAGMLFRFPRPLPTLDRDNSGTAIPSAEVTAGKKKTRRSGPIIQTTRHTTRVVLAREAVRTFDRLILPRRVPLLPRGRMKSPHRFHVRTEVMVIFLPFIA